MYGSRTLGVNFRVAVSLTLSSFNLVSLEGMECPSLPLIITLVWARICAFLGSKANWCVCNTKKQQTVPWRYFTNSLT